MQQDVGRKLMLCVFARQLVCRTAGVVLINSSSGFTRFEIKLLKYHQNLG